jgi:hypothetical protein
MRGMRREASKLLPSFSTLLRELVPAQMIETYY